MLDYNEFQEKVLNCIKEKLGGGYKVELHSVKKNNGVTLISVMIQEVGSDIVPNIYLEDFYEQYCVSSTIEDIADCIIGIYRKHKGKIKLSVEEFASFEGLKDRIYLKLINYERNAENLIDVPHKRFLDLAIVYYVFWDKQGDIMTSIVTRSHIKLWKVAEDELHEIACRNTYSENVADIINMKAFVCDLYAKVKGGDKEAMLKGLDKEAGCMYILTNKCRMLGAITMLNDEVLKKIYEIFGAAFYILPSSIHEVIAVPENDMSVSELIAMVTDINESEVDYMEVLSDNVYRYDGEEVKIAE